MGRLADRVRLAPRPTAGAAGLIRCTALLICGWAAAVEDFGRAAAADRGVSGLEQNVEFAGYSPLTRSTELARRMLTPLAFRRLEQAAAAPGRRLREQPVDLASERFAVHVPAGPPPAAGFGVLVFIPPWSRAELPPGWSVPLDRHRLIFVSPANAGNEANVYDRRVPLAVLALENVRRLHPVDPQRVYIGGLSGGSRAALIAAIAYPDVFHGALLDAGSERIGEQGIRLPPADLFRRFQESTRLVYVSGERDELNVHQDLVSEDSMRTWCVFNLSSEVVPGLEHETMSAQELARALDALERPAAAEQSRLTRCRAKIDRELTSRLKAAGAALARGDRRGAHAMIEAIDKRFGGLAGTAAVELEAAAAADRPGGR